MSDIPVDFSSRVLCSDGNCIGVIGVDGKCKVCGRPYESETPIESLLVTCETCSQKFSKRAGACPKCGWKPQVRCQICQEKIPFDSTVCPECGDPEPFELKEKNTQEKFSAVYEKTTSAQNSKNSKSQVNESPSEHKIIFKETQPNGFSWKSFLIAFLIAAFLSAFLSAVAEVEPRKNIVWTAFWIYLSIEAWKYWKWKALLPYPLYLVVSFILQAILASTGNERSSWAYLIAILITNIGGLSIFYMLFRKSQKQVCRITK